MTLRELKDWFVESPDCYETLHEILFRCCDREQYLTETLMQRLKTLHGLTGPIVVEHNDPGRVPLLKKEEIRSQRDLI